MDMIGNEVPREPGDGSGGDVPQLPRPSGSDPGPGRRFSSQTLAEIFRDLYLEERSGVLELSHENESKRVYFDRGLILFAESELEEEDLGSRLVQEGKISAGALEEARRSVSDPKDLAQALVNRGLIGKEPLSHTVRFIIDHVIQGAFRWHGGVSRFTEGRLAQDLFESDIVTTFETILGGVRAMVGFDAIMDAMRTRENLIRIRQPCPFPLERLTLSPAHGFILSRADGTTRVQDVLAILPPGEEGLACRFLYGLLVMGVMEYDPPVQAGRFSITSILAHHADDQATEQQQTALIRQTYERIHEPPHQLLGLPVDASRSRIDEAYNRLKEPFQTERLLPAVRERFKSELGIISSRLVEAYLTLTQPKAGAREEGPENEVTADSLLVRVEMDKTRSKQAKERSRAEAEKHYVKGRKFLADGDYHTAIQYAKLAISYDPEDARFYAMLGDCQIRNPGIRWQKMAEEAYQQAVKCDPWKHEYRLTLARFYRNRGMTLRARKQYEQALKIDPTNAEIAAELKAL